ncbi:tail-specific protease [Candidatus Marinamargulisbacteria bacterium SCGC AAA071-K20]|nr:tail-specific protease [Candidatus Marinamargulisbacteria bacterium SCGC AAA071-K20]
MSKKNSRFKKDEISSKLRTCLKYCCLHVVKFMKKNNQHFKFAGIFLICIFSFLFARALTQNQALNQALFTSVNNLHFSPIPIDDTYSSSVYSLYIKRLDPNKRFFTKSDIKQFKQFEHLIDNELNQGSQYFFEQINDRLTFRMQETQKYYKAFFKKKIRINQKETLETDIDKKEFARSEKELKKRWEKWMSYQVIIQYMTELEVKITSENASKKVKVEGISVLPVHIKMNTKLKKKAMEKVEKDLDLMFERLTEENDEDKLNLYVDTLLNVFDTHTGYFPPQKKEDFDISMSGKLEGIGAVLREENGYIKVVRIVPGSASWRQGDLKEDDLIIKVAQSKGETVDIVGVRVRDAVKLIRGEKGSLVKLTVKKPDGSIKVVPIVRDVVVIEATYAKSSLINDTRYGKVFGYVYLPKFYRDFKDATARNTTDDIRRILEGLKKKNVDGIVLDLRSNEGGALLDAVNTAGLFIKKGPIVQVKSRHKKSNVLFDEDKEIVYGGPLIIMVNRYSASASEILAAALQDYSRAVIVGTSNSFGKGTVQTFIDLDSVFKGKADPKHPFGNLKITIQKFYRINGGSTQYKGVHPDIILPDRYSYLEVGEQYLDHSLPWDTVDKLNYNEWTQKQNISSLRSKSAHRSNQSKLFSHIEAHVSFVKKQRENSDISIYITDVIKQRNLVEAENKRYKDSIINYKSLKITDMTPKLSNDDDTKKRQAEWIESLQKDPYLNESLSILNDMTQSDFAQSE